MNDPSFYEILGVNKNASPEEIKQKYKKLALQFHPDRHCSKTKEEENYNMEKFKQISEAFDVLSDPHKRDCYDRRGQQFQNCSGGFTTHDPFDIFKQFFGNVSFDDPVMSMDPFQHCFFNMGMPRHSSFNSQTAYHQPFNRMADYNTHQIQSSFCGAFSSISSSRSESFANGVRTVNSKTRDSSGNVEEIEEVSDGRETARIVKQNGRIVDKQGSTRLLSLF